MSLDLCKKKDAPLNIILKKENFRNVLRNFPIKAKFSIINPDFLFLKHIKVAIP